MSFRFEGAKDITAFCQAVANGSQNPPQAGGSFSGRVIIDANPSNGSFGKVVHHLPSDRYWAPFRARSLPPDVFNAFGYVDPAFISSAFPDSRYVNNSEIGSSAQLNFLIPDQYNPATNQQRLFTRFASGALVEINTSTLAHDPNVFGGAWNPDGASNPGYNWSANSIHHLVFTGLTDGIPNETEATGTNVYPSGLFLASNCSGQINSQSFANRFAWIDIATRDCVGILGATDVPGGVFTALAFPQLVSGTVVENSEALIAGDAFDWLAIQYIPDSDATFATPKGEMLFTNFQELPTIGTPSPGDVYRNYVRFTDFNPFGVDYGGNSIPRTHGLIRDTSRVLVEVAPAHGLAGQDDIQNPTGQQVVLWDAYRRRLVVILSNKDDIELAGDGVGGATVGYFRREAELSYITTPAARDAPRTNDVTDFEVQARGDLGEVIAGVDVGWTLTRRSTIDEVLTISGGIGTTSTVANGPIDQSIPQANEGTLVVVADTITLAEGTDYTVVLATGVITWVTDQSGATQVTASYEHRSTAATPPHGTLLASSSATDVDGNAATQVLVADDDSIVGQIDQLEAVPL